MSPKSALSADPLVFKTSSTVIWNLDKKDKLVTTMHSFNKNKKK